MRILLSILMIISATFIFAENVVVLDYSPNVIDVEQRNSFINEFCDYLLANGYSNLNVVMDNSLETYWNNVEMIKENTADYSPDIVIMFKYYVFGDNFVVKMTVIDINQVKVIKTEEFSLEEPEELKTVAKKASMVFVHNKSVKELEQVGLMIPNEQKEILNKRGNGLMGISFAAGYMWTAPTTKDNLYAGSYRKVLMLAASLPIEVSVNGRMDITFELPIAASIAGLVGYTYIFNPTKVTPYIGADAGIEYVYHRASIYPSASNGGIVIKPKVGYIVMNTFKASLFVEAAYRLVTDDYTDSGVEFRFGFIFR